MSTDVSNFLGDLDAGLVEQALSKVLSETAGAVIDFNKVGKVDVSFTLKRNATTQQINVHHKIQFKRPTSKGNKSETLEGVTPMYVGERGRMTLMPERQTDMFGRPEKATGQA